MNLFWLMLVIINPFAQVVYLAELMRSLDKRSFAVVHIKATLLSFGVFILFSLVGDWLLKEVFQVQLASLQIFGGLIILMIAYRYVTVGAGSNLLFRGNIADLAPQISLPYMVGPGTIWASILIGREYAPLWGISMIAGVLAINMVFVIAVQSVYDRLARKSETLIGNYFAILMRTNALFIGAIAMQMIISGIRDAFPYLTQVADAPLP